MTQVIVREWDPLYIYMNHIWWNFCSWWSLNVQKHLTVSFCQWETSLYKLITTWSYNRVCKVHCLWLAQLLLEWSSRIPGNFLLFKNIICFNILSRNANIKGEHSILQYTTCTPNHMESANRKRKGIFYFMLLWELTGGWKNLNV